MPKLLVLMLFCTMGLVSGCGASQAPNRSEGEKLVTQTLIGTAPGCATCHSLEAGVQIVGPSFSGVASRAEAIIQDGDYSGIATDAAGYLRESIVDPDAYVASDFIPGSMYQKYGSDLNPEQIQAIVDYLVTLQ